MGNIVWHAGPTMLVMYVETAQTVRLWYECCVNRVCLACMLMFVWYALGEFSVLTWMEIIKWKTRSFL